MIEYLFSWGWWIIGCIVMIFLIALILDWLDEDEFIAEQIRIEKEEENI